MLTEGGDDFHVIYPPIVSIAGQFKEGLWLPRFCNGKDSFFVCMYASVVILTDRLGTLFVLLLERNCAFRWKDVSIRPNGLLIIGRFFPHGTASRE